MRGLVNFARTHIISERVIGLMLGVKYGFSFFISLHSFVISAELLKFFSRSNIELKIWRHNSFISGKSFSSIGLIPELIAFLVV